MPLPQIEDDPIRQIIDDQLAETLSLPSAANLRSMLAREPIISNESLSVPEPTDQEENGEELFHQLGLDFLDVDG